MMKINHSADFRGKIFSPSNAGAIAVCFWLAACFCLGGGRSFGSWAVFSLALWGASVFLLKDVNAVSETGHWAPWAIWLIISLSGSAEPFNSVWFVWKQITFLLLFVFAGKYFKGEASRLWVGTVFLCAFAGGASVFILNRPWGILWPNPGYTACLLAACAAAAFSIFTEKGVSGIRKIPALAVALAFTATIASMRVRGALAAVVIYCGFMLFNRRYYRALFFLFAASMLFLLVSPSGYTGYIMKVSDPYAFQRLDIWRAAVSVILDFPFMGTGAGCFERGYYLHNPSVFNGVSCYSHFANHAHNEILNMAAETGIAGAVLFLMAFWKTSVRTKDDPAGRACLAIAAALFIEALVDGIFMLPLIPLIFFGSLGAAVENGPPQRPSGTRGLYVAGFIMCAAVFVFRQVSLSWHGRAFSEGDLSRKKTYIGKALKVFPADHELMEEAAMTGLMSSPVQPAGAIARLEKAFSLNPTQARYPEKMGEIYAAAGDWGSVRRNALEALILEPNFVEARLLLVRAYLRGDVKKTCFQLDYELKAAESIYEHLNKKQVESGYDSFLLRLDRKSFLKLKSEIRAKCAAGTTNP